MKLNNKGMTLVEVVVTFGLLIFIVFGMLQLVVSLKTKASTTIYEKGMLEFTSILNMELQNDIITLNYVSSSDCTNVSSPTIVCKNISFKDENKQLLINLNSKIIQYDGKNYEIPSKDMIEFRDSRVYNQNPVNHELDVYIEDDTEYLTINVPFFEIGTDTNYGFKIVHPIEGYTTSASCFAFDRNTGTITNYYNYLNNNSSNGACPKHVVIPTKIGGVEVKTIAANAFNNKGLTQVRFNNGVTTINSSAFANNAIEEVVLPNSLVTIADSAFANNEIVRLTIPDNVTSIGASAFANNNLWTVTLGDSLTALGANSFLKSTTSNPSLFNITNLSLRSYNWQQITGSSRANSFATGTIVHQNGNITVEQE